MQKPTISLISLFVSFLVLAPAAAADPKPGGFWCWTHQDGDLGLCAREQDQCRASLDGYNRTASALLMSPVTNECTRQPRAWELRTTRKAVGPGHHYPQEKLCRKGLAQGESCRLVE